MESKVPVSLIRCIDKGICSIPEPQTRGRICAPPLGTRDAMLLWPQRPPNTCLIVKKWRDADARDAADDIGFWLRETFGVRVLFHEDAEEEERADASFERFDPAVQSSDIVDVVVTVGGDGTVLHVSSLFQGAIPPLVAVAFGSLGFMTVHSFKSAAKMLRRMFDQVPYVEAGMIAPTKTPAPLQPSSAAHGDGGEAAFRGAGQGPACHVSVDAPSGHAAAPAAAADAAGEHTEAPPGATGAKEHPCDKAGRTAAEALSLRHAVDPISGGRATGTAKLLGEGGTRALGAASNHAGTAATECCNGGSGSAGAATAAAVPSALPRHPSRQASEGSTVTFATAGSEAASSTSVDGVGGGPRPRVASEEGTGPQPISVSLRMRLTVEVYRCGQRPEEGDAPERTFVVLNELLLERGSRCVQAYLICPDG